jgi:hypothetical protein
MYCRLSQRVLRACRGRAFPSPAARLGINANAGLAGSKDMLSIKGLWKNDQLPTVTNPVYDWRPTWGYNSSNGEERGPQVQELLAKHYQSKFCTVALLSYSHF